MCIYTYVYIYIYIYVCIYIYIVFVFPKCSMLELKNKECERGTRILREISSLEPAPKVWNPKSRSPTGFLLTIAADVLSVLGRSKVPGPVQKLEGL